MSKARELVKPELGEKHCLSSDVVVTVVPFPAGLWEKINTKALREFPDPIPPKRQIKVVDGFEEVDDLENPEFVAKKAEMEAARSNLLGEAVIDLCVKLPLADWESQISRMERYTEAYPTDPDDRRMRFLTDYALRSKGDYEKVMVSAITQMAIGDKEIAERLTNFRDTLAQSADNGAGASGIAQVVRLDIQP